MKRAIQPIENVQARVLKKLNTLSVDA